MMHRLPSFLELAMQRKAEIEYLERDPITKYVQLKMIKDAIGDPFGKGHLVIQTYFMNKPKIKPDEQNQEDKQ